jgi:hypothetical protein
MWTSGTKKPFTRFDAGIRVFFFLLPMTLIWYFIATEGYIPGKNGYRLYYSERPFGFIFVTTVFSLLGPLMSWLTINDSRRGVSRPIVKGDR